MYQNYKIVRGLTVFSVLAAMAVSEAFAADRTIPAGYYNRIDGKREGDLKTALHNVIYSHTEVSSYSDLPKYFQRTDMYPGTRQWWDMYGNIPLYGPSFSGLNREHSLPKSWWGGSTTIPAYVDLNHLYPSEAKANQAKSNYPLGVVDRSTSVRFDNGVSLVGFAVTGQGGGAAYVFEPDDEYKGDFARTYFYMATCYQNLTWKYTYMLSNNLYPTLNGWSQELLLKWHRQDPVSQKEIDRNEVIYSIQANRNPFIDFPELAEYIWGENKGDAFILSEHEGGADTSGKPVLITPVQGMELDFGEVAIGRSNVAKLHLLGENLTGKTLALSIYDNAETKDAALFSMDDGNQRFNASVSAVNSQDGLWVNVTYTPTSVGSHSTRMVISGGGISGSLGIGLTGQCLPEPVLTAPTANDPTDVTTSSYTANWTPVEGEVVDYFVVNRTRYEGGAASTEQLVAEENSLEITEFSGSESYTVQSVRLGVYSPQSNVVFVGQNSITGVDNSRTFGLRRHPDGVMLTGSDVIGRIMVYDTTGRLILETEDSRNGDVLELNEGIYFIRSVDCGKTLRIVISEF
ncbi:MAG: endonuclease [Muribaculaceae bacterium]|nr:endonuclease [Muribaculaceae bacterium]MDE5971418.1 endonuclease [Muribaculaceae bacterium]MDE6461635.1 endonuclease [Muribaculaceae bacterium]